MAEREKSMENEVAALRKAGRDRERDLVTLNTVLQCNQDVINVRTHTHTYTRTRTGVHICSLCHAQFTLRGVIFRQSCFVDPVSGPTCGSG